jgi:molybdopterin-guanine dinucleotide biosynthesis protein A
MRISGIILAGGKSTRMGQAKPFLMMNGKRMIDVVVEKLKELFSEVVIVTDGKGEFAGLGCRVVEDVVKGCGPLGGIYTGLREVSGDGAFFAACDMPFLHKGLISRLIDLTDFENYECVVPRHSKGLPQKRIEPLHAVYSGRIVPAIEKSLGAGKLSLRELLANCRCKYVDVGEDEVGSFTNVNTPEDLVCALTYCP